MKFYFFFLLISKIIFSSQDCVAGTNLCTKCNPITKLCIKCEKNIYAPDDKGGCTNAKKCFFGYNHCVQCNEDETLCKECDVGYFPDENGGCSITENCEISYKGDCIKCTDNYILIGRQNYYSSISEYIRICKPLSSESLQNCDSINYERGTCYSCKNGYYLSKKDYLLIVKFQMMVQNAMNVMKIIILMGKGNVFIVIIVLKVSQIDVINALKIII